MMQKPRRANASNEVRFSSDAIVHKSSPGVFGKQSSTYAQATYGNQAVLRMLRGKSAETPRLESIQRKPSCGCGGSCGRCGGKQMRSPQRLNEIGVDEEEAEKYSDQGVLLTSESPGSGTCFNGGADSGCDMNDGVFKIVRVRNTCCTKDCSIKHEQTHIKDVTGWGCCKAASVAYNKPGVSQSEVVDKYNNWQRSVQTLTECHAHQTSIDCAQELAKKKDCSGAGKDTDCCKDIDQYRENYAAKIDTFCKAAPKDAPPCPAF